VGYTARQLADGFELLRVAELFLQALVLGDVIKHTLHQESAVAGRGAQHYALVTEPEDSAVAGKHAVLRLEQLLGLLKALLRRDGNLTILGVDVVQPMQRVREPLGG